MLTCVQAPGVEQGNNGEFKKRDLSNAAFTPNTKIIVVNAKTREDSYSSVKECDHRPDIIFYYHILYYRLYVPRFLQVQV